MAVPSQTELGPPWGLTGLWDNGAHCSDAVQAKGVKRGPKKGKGLGRDLELEEHSMALLNPEFTG